MNKPGNSIRLHIGVLSCLLLSACGSGSESNSTDVLNNSLSKNTQIATTVLEAGDKDCTNGGVSIDTGIDENGDGALTTDEITQTRIICNGSQGSDSLIRIYDEPAGDNCEYGGKKIQVGLDSNKDAKLTDTEVSDTQFICDAEPPVPVEANPGSLFSIIEEPAGENCATGGKGILTGVDTDADGILSQNEISDINYLCNGELGVSGSITRSLQSITCSGPLENMKDLLWSYEIHELTSGDAVVTASIYGPDTTVGSLAFYSGQELANNAVKPAVSFVYDIVAQNNYGLWTIYLDEVEGRTVVIYNDTDQDPNPSAWSMSVDNCTTTIFE